MASPQLENGHIRLANELVDALFRTNLSPYESRMLWYIVRRTYGWNKKRERISYNQIENDVGITRRHAARALSTLIQRNIIGKFGHEHTIRYGLQKDYEQWGEPIPDKRDRTKEKKPKKATPKISKAEMMDVFEFWNSLNIIVHQKLTPTVGSQISRSVIAYGKDLVLQAMANYAELVNGDYEWSHRWTLHEFLERSGGNNIERFKNMEILRKNYGRRTEVNSRNSKQLPTATGYTRPEEFFKDK